MSSFFVIKRKRSAKAEEIEFKAVDKHAKKKKGKIYSGASLIGKRDGAIAELKAKSQRTASRTGPKTESTYKVKERKSRTWEISKDMKKFEPILPAEPLSSSSLKNIAMIKTLEGSVDIESKIKFMISHIESILQNIEFFKSILQTHPQNELYCPNCNKKMSKYWSACPYCAISKQDDELSLKLSMLTVKSDIKFCPDCKRIIKPDWVVCPFCFIKKQI